MDAIGRFHGKCWETHRINDTNECKFCRDLLIGKGSTVEGLVQSARFYELLGYTLSVLAFVILGAGVIWSLRLHVSQKRRKLFLVTSLLSLVGSGGGVLLWLVLSQPLTIRPLDVHRRPPIESRPRENTTPVVITVDVDPQGNVLFEGREVAVDRLVAQLRLQHPHKRLHVALRVDPKTTLLVVHRILDELNEQGVEFSFRVRN